MVIFLDVGSLTSVAVSVSVGNRHRLDVRRLSFLLYNADSRARIGELEDFFAIIFKLDVVISNPSLVSARLVDHGVKFLDESFHSVAQKVEMAQNTIPNCFAVFWAGCFGQMTKIFV